MSNEKQRRVLAIAIDAAEPAFVRQLVERGEMPALKSLLDSGRWLRVLSPARIGSGSVWPTFISGKGPAEHGVYGEWLWNAGEMGLARYRGNDVEPFWERFVAEGISVGIFDVPFMPMIGLTSGFEISEWGPHDIVECRTLIAPQSIEQILNGNSRHPLQERMQVNGPGDYRNLETLSRACLDGIKLRGETGRTLISATQTEFTLITFTEIHHSGHYLWHNAEPAYPVYASNGFAGLRETHPTMTEIFRELDQQIVELVTTAGRDTAVVVFSLHGMRPAHGVPAFLPELLCEIGIARKPSWKQQPWRERVLSWFAKAKRAMPQPLRKLYYAVASQQLTFKLAQPTMLPQYDWSHTRAFALPSDQHGWIRINLAGRERLGIVPKELYEQTCVEIEEQLRKLRSEAGEPLVSEVFRTAANAEAAMKQRLPDIVVHWSDAVFASPLRIAGSEIEPEMTGRKYVGQHSLEGFCIAPAGAGSADDFISSEEMHAMFSSLLSHR